MELIYMNNDFEELGIIKDFTIDLAYGKDENDFEIKTPENEMLQGYYWRIKDTEYGGVIDEIESTSKNNEVTYRGRTWSGILNSFSGMQVKQNGLYYSQGIPIEEIEGEPVIRHRGVEKDHFLEFKGTPKAILEQILIKDLGLNVLIMDDSYDEDIIEARVSANQYLYDVLRELFRQFNMKIIFDFDSKLLVGVRAVIDFSDDNYFDSSQYQLKVNSNAKIPNHLIGVYDTDDMTYVKHIYIDEYGVIQPYYSLDPTHSDKPINDFEYRRVEGEKVIDGLNEIVEVIEGGSTIEQYDVVSELKGVDTDHPYGTEGNTAFTNGVPYDWKDRCYDLYYYYDEETKSYKNHVLEWEYEQVTNISEDEWAKTFTNYFKRSDEPDPQTGKYTFTQYSKDDLRYLETEYARLDAKPGNWSTSYGNYFYRYYEGGIPHWEHVTKIPYYYYDTMTTKNAPRDWNTNKGSYYMWWYDDRYMWRVEYQIYIKGKWEIVYGQEPPIDFKNANIELVGGRRQVFNVKNDLSSVTFTQKLWKDVKKENGTKQLQLVSKNTNLKKEVKNVNFTNHHKFAYISDRSRFKIYKRQRYQHKQMHTTVNEYCSKNNKKLKDIKYKVSTFEWRRTYERDPDFYRDRNYFGDKTGFYTSEITTSPPIRTNIWRQVDSILPGYESGKTYIKVNDHYTNLCEAMITKYKEIVESQSKFEPKIDTELMDLDVDDIVGGVHPITKEEIKSKVVKKIVKGGTFGLTIDYEIG